MSDMIYCAECDSTFVNGPGMHDCPGLPADRLDALEAMVDELEEELAALKERLGSDDGK